MIRRLVMKIKAFFKSLGCDHMVVQHIAYDYSIPKGYDKVCKCRECGKLVRVHVNLPYDVNLR